MEYHELIEYLEEEILNMEANHSDRWRGDYHYSDDMVEKDKKLIAQMACTINILKDQMFELENQ